MKDYINQLITNFELIKQEINHLSKPTSIIVASKTMSVGGIETLYNIGQYAFAENYCSEFKIKTSQLQHLKNIEWHFIGTLQRNKLKYIASVAKWIHSLEKEAHAVKLNQILQNQNISDITQTKLSISPLELKKSEELKKYKKSLNVLIQVNISNDNNKHGLRTLDAVTNLANTITQQSNLCFRGLMGMASNTQNIEKKTKKRRSKRLGS